MKTSFNLEHLNACPVCASNQRSLLYDSLHDDNTGVAEGEWTLWQCSACTAAYLDPRPDKETIGQAYQGYGMHQELMDEFPDTQSPKSAFVKSLRNGYINSQYHTKFQPSNPLGVALSFVPEQSTRSGSWIYYMRLPLKPHPTLLDVGSGNGLFVRRMVKAGWEAKGLEPGEAGVESGRKAGLDITHGTLEEAEFPAHSFDAITMGHSIEHLHDPVSGIKKVYGWLVPGGQLFVGTPNIASYLRPKLGRFWFPLDVPRHLILYSPKAIELLLSNAGFRQIKFHPVVSEESRHILQAAKDRMKDKPDVQEIDVSVEGKLAQKAAQQDVRAFDSIALTAVKESD